MQSNSNGAFFVKNFEFESVEFEIYFTKFENLHFSNVTQHVDVLDKTFKMQPTDVLGIELIILIANQDALERNK